MWLTDRFEKILTIAVVVILFAVAGLMFWAGLFPTSFSRFFSFHPFASKTLTQSRLLSPSIEKLLLATSSEAVLGTNGQIIINNVVWNVEIAKNEDEQNSGLSNRKTLFKKKGMLFVFDTYKPHTFWMKDMIIPIDIVFFDENWKIAEIKTDIRPDSFPKIFGGDIKSKYVMEINANEALDYSLAIGDQAIFLNK